MARTYIDLGGVPLTITNFRWPQYRGAEVHPVKIDVSARKFDELAALPRVVSMTVRCSAAAADGEDVLTIKGVRILELVQVDDRRAYIVLGDARADLFRLICDRDVNILFDDDYLEGTFAPSVATLLAKLRESIPQFDAIFGGTINTDEIGLDDDLPTAGPALFSALDRALTARAADLTVDNDGLIWFVDRQDVEDENVPTLSSYRWLSGAEPGWVVQKRVVRGLPKKFRVFYWERHTLRLTLADDSATVASGQANEELRVELQQLYRDGNDYYTLEELLEAYDQPSTAINDSIIAKKWATKKFEDSELQLDGSTSKRDVVAIIKRDWRRLYKIDYPSARGRHGAWTDFKPGRVTREGLVTQGAVRCPWVKFQTEIKQLDENDPLVGRDMTTNHDSVNGVPPAAPFDVVWEREGEILRLVPNEDAGSDGFVMPGSLVAPLQLDYTTAQEAKDNDVPKPDEFVPLVLEINPKQHAQFTDDFVLHVFVTAVRRLPNDSTRWWLEEPSGFDDGEVEYADLEVGTELECRRDFVDPNDDDHPDAGDGFGSVLNAVELDKDARARARAKRTEIGRKLEGDAEAIGVKAFAELRVRGAIREKELRVEGLYVGTRIVVGNLAPLDLLQKTAARREAQRKRAARGKVIA